MEVYMKSSKKNYDAVGEFDPEKKSLVVKKGSVVSGTISESKTFRGAKTVLKLWEESVKNNKVIKDMPFKSASTAANYVTGQSTNGMRTWKNEAGIAVGDLLKGEKD